MATINFARREIEIKVVYCGPAMSGKTTNVRMLHTMVPDQHRGDLHTLATEGERTLFFDYVPLELGQIAGFAAKFKLFTVPGQAFYRETRRIVLQGADAVVFVADSTRERAQANIDALVDLEEHLSSQGLMLTAIPLVLQFNKRDVDGAMTTMEMNTELNPFGVPMVEVVARTGQGVVDTLLRVTEIAVQRVRDNLAGRGDGVRLVAMDSPEGKDADEVVRELFEQVQAIRPVEEARAARMRQAARLRPDDVGDLLDEDAPEGDVSEPAAPLPVIAAGSLGPAPVVSTTGEVSGGVAGELPADEIPAIGAGRPPLPVALEPAPPSEPLGGNEVTPARLVQEQPTDDGAGVEPAPEPGDGAGAASWQRPVPPPPPPIPDRPFRPVDPAAVDEGTNPSGIMARPEPEPAPPEDWTAPGDARARSQPQSRPRVPPPPPRPAIEGPPPVEAVAPLPGWASPLVVGLLMFTVGALLALGVAWFAFR
jgi:signal recognition particle receptor subunit beta